MAGSTEAVAGLLARFTADRDALIAAIEACQERVTLLAARLDGETPSETVTAASPARSTPLDELRAEVTTLRVEMLGRIERLEGRLDELALEVRGANP